MPVVKRYSNRKLYNMDAKQYVTLDGVADLIRRGEDVQVIDHESGDDITALITAQVIFAQEKKIGGLLPHSVLTNLIQAGSDKLNQLRQTFTTAPDWEAQVNAEIERRVQALIDAGELEEKEGRRWLEKLLASDRRSQKQEARPITDVEIEHALQSRGAPSRAALERLTRQVQALNTELDRLLQPDTAKPAKAGRRPAKKR